MNQPPNQPMNTPPGYGQPQQQQPSYGAPGHSAPLPDSGSYQPQQGVRGMTRQMFNPASYKQPGSGSWAAASLILALIGWVTLGCLGFLTWPLGLLFGLIGLVGNKRAKGMSFAGVLLSGLGIAGMVAFFAFGFYTQFNTEGNAEQAGAPVVAAIAEFKNDHERVPHSIDELVEQGYLPPTWDQGLDDLDGPVRNTVEGKKWSDFLAYAPGKNADWEGGPQTTGGGLRFEGDLDDWSMTFGDDATTEHQTYGLTFIGLDGIWESHDDAAVNQSPENAYELTDAWGGDSKTREIAKKRRELKALQRKLTGNIDRYETSAEGAGAELEKTKEEIAALRIERQLSTYEQLKQDARGGGLLKLAGVLQKRLQLASKKLKNTRDRLDVIDIQIRLLQNEEEMAKLADSPQELAELETLLEESEKVLDTGGDLGGLDKLDEEKAAEDWFNATFS